MPFMEVKLRLFFLTVKSTFMALSQEEKLINLGIDIWKKRPGKEISLSHNEIFLIDKDLVFVIGDKDKKLKKEDKRSFLLTLTKSIGRHNLQQLERLIQVENMSHIFLLNVDMPTEIDFLESLNVINLPSITEICSSRDNKENFLISLFELDL